MSDKVLKELLREEKKRRESDKDHRSQRRETSSGKNRNRSKEKHRSRDRRRNKSEERQRNKHKSKNRRSRSEEKKKEESIEIMPPQIEDNREKFMFLYEDSEGKLYKNLSEILKKNEIEATIFPVYFEGENDNLTPEFVTYREDKWTPSEENKETSWLNVIHSQDENIVILDFDEKDVVVYNGKFFHCQDDIIYYLKEYGCEYLDVVE